MTPDLQGSWLVLAPVALLLARASATAHAALAARVLSPPRGPQRPDMSTARDEPDTAVREEVNIMSAHTVDTPPLEAASPPITAEPVRAEADRYEGIQQYSLKKIIGVWAAAAIPMGVLAWVVAPVLKDQFSGPEPLVQSLLVCLTAGLAWQFVLVLILLRQEIGSFEWPRVRDALWLRPPRDPKTGCVGGKTWWWALPFFLAFAAWGPVAALALELPIPHDRDLNKFLGSETGQDFFSGAWGWFAVIAALAVFNTLLGEELLFRGVLLPRMRGVFGRRDWLANGAIFALYHLHMPWAILPTFVDGIFLDAYPSRRFQSAWMGIVVHSGQSVLLVGLFLALVLS
jgi:CAAX protease family protein